MIQPKIPLSPLRRRYPFPDDHRWIEAETFQGDDFIGKEGSFETLSSSLFEGGTAQFYEVFSENVIVDDFVQIEQMMITDNTLSSLQENQDIRILPKGENGGIQFGLSLRILDNALLSQGEDENIVLSPQGNGLVQSNSDLEVMAGKSLLLQDAQNKHSAALTYSTSLVNFLQYTWPSPPLAVLPVPGNIVGPYMTSDSSGHLSWKTQTVPPAGTEPYGVGPYLSSDAGGQLSWTTTVVTPDVPVTIGPYLSSDAGGVLFWASREVLMITPTGDPR